MGIGHGPHDPVPDACVCPTIETVINRCVGTVLIRQITPWDAGAQDIENAVDNTPVIDPLHPSAVVRKDCLDELPFQIAHV